MKITKKSILTGITHVRDLPINIAELDRHHRGEHAQDVWPHLNPNDREFLISGITPEEWEEAFGTEE